MPIHYEFTSLASDDAPVEMGTVEASGSVASAAASAAMARDGFVTITATENGYIQIGSAVTAAAADPRRRVLAGVARSFKVSSGDKIGFTAG